MANKVFGPVVTGGTIKSELRTRSQTNEFHTIKASKWNLIMEKVKTAEKEGWTKEKRYKKSYKVSRSKPLDEQLEDELWCLAARMGFTELSSGRKFHIETKIDPNPSQIDVFAKDDEVALVIECTQRKIATKSSSANMSTLIDKISKIQGYITGEIANRYKNSGKLKTKFIIATRRIEWGEADLQKCETLNICVLADKEIDYYKDLTKHSKSAARFQMLAHFFADVAIPGLSNEVLATKGMMGDVNFYNFLMEPSELLKISYVSHMASRSQDDFDSYQRMLRSNRLRSIASYIRSGGKFPTNIIVNLKKTRNRNLVFEGLTTKKGVTVELRARLTHFLRYLHLIVNPFLNRDSFSYSGGYPCQGGAIFNANTGSNLNANQQISVRVPVENCT